MNRLSSFSILVNFCFRNKHFDALICVHRELNQVEFFSICTGVSIRLTSVFLRLQSELLIYFFFYSVSQQDDIQRIKNEDFR